MSQERSWARIGPETVSILQSTSVEEHAPRQEVLDEVIKQEAKRADDRPEKQSR